MARKKAVFGCIHAARGNRFPHHDPLKGKKSVGAMITEGFLKLSGAKFRFTDGDIIQGFIKPKAK